MEGVFNLKRVLVLIFVLIFASCAFAETVTVSSYSDLAAALSNVSADTIIISNDIEVEDTLKIERSVALKGRGASSQDDPKPVLKMKTKGSASVIDCEGSKMKILLQGLTISDGNGGLAINLVQYVSFDIENCIFVDNEVTNGISYGGAIKAMGLVDLNIKDSIFRRNSSGNNGGAIYLVVGANANIERCTFIDNQADRYGGAIYVNGMCALNLTNCTFTGNTAGNGRPGGGLYVDGTANIINCTFVNNSAKSGAEISTGDFDDNIKIQAANSIFYNESASNYIKLNKGSISLYNCAYSSGDVLVGAVKTENCIADLNWAGREATPVEPVNGLPVFRLVTGNTEDEKLIDKGLAAGEVKTKLELDFTPNISIDEESATRSGLPDIGAKESVSGENIGGNSEDGTNGENATSSHGSSGGCGMGFNALSLLALSLISLSFKRSR